MFRFSKWIRALWAGWVGLLVQDGSCAGNLNFISKDLAAPHKVFFPFLCHSVTITSWSNGPQRPCKTQHRLLLSDTCSQCFFFRIRGWRASATSCKVAESICGCRFESKCECFSVANILSLKTCNSTSSLCCPEFCGLPQCYHYHLLLFIFLPPKVVLDGDKSLLIYETLNGRGIMEARFARKLSWGLFAVQQNSSLNMAVDAPSVLLSCSAYDSLSHAALHYLLSQNCTCEHSHKRYSTSERPQYNTLASTRGLENACGRSRSLLIKELRLEGGRHLLRGV